MHDLSKLVSSNNTLRTITDLFTEGTYLVGGCVRDMLLGIEPSDFDVVTFCDVWQKARQIGDRLASTTFWMDKDRGVVRIALKDYDLTIDVASPKGADLVEDLKKRDITINAMGFDVSAGELVDPTGGLSDLGHGVIRIISEENLKDDPLRAVRCVRFSVMLGFAIVESSAALLKKHASKVKTVSPERVKQECMKALSYPYGARFFSLMDRVGLMGMLFARDSSSGQSQGLTGSRPALIMAFEMDGLIYDVHKLLAGIDDMLTLEVETGLSRAALLRLVTVLYGMGFPWSTHEGTAGTGAVSLAIEQCARGANAFCRSFRFSSNALQMVQRTIACQAMVHDILIRKDLSGSLLHTLCSAADPFLPEVLLLARARLSWNGAAMETAREGSRMKELMEKAWSYHTHTYLEHKRSPLMSGEDVMNALGLPPGPQVGKVLHIIEMARADGVVHTRREALDYLLSIDL